MEQNRIEKLHSKYIGLHSSRFQSCFMTNNDTPSVFYAKGSYICKRNAETLDEIFSFKAHDTSIMVLLPIPVLNPTHIISLTYAGDMGIYTLEGDLLHYVETENQNQGFQKIMRHGCTNNNGNLLATVSLYGNYNGIIEVWKVSIERGFSKILTFRGNYKNCEFSHVDSLFMIRETAIDDGEPLSQHQSDLPISEENALVDFSLEEENEPIEDYQERIGKRHKKVVSYYVSLTRNLEGEIDQKFIFYPCYARVNCIKSNKLGQVVLGFLTRMIVVWDIESLTPLHTLHMEGNGSISCIEFIGTNVYFSPLSEYFCRFSINQPPFEKLFDVKNGSTPELYIVRTNQEWINRTTWYYGWVIPEVTLIGFNENGISNARFKDFLETGEIIESKHINLFKVTCCGLSINNQGTHVAIGDFDGSVMIFTLDSCTMVARTHVNTSVRCIIWDLEGKNLYIGTLDGQIIFISDVLGNMQEPITLTTVEESVICMSWKEDIIKNLMAVGTTKGDLFIFTYQDGILCQEQKILAHDKQEWNDDAKFGSLSLFSEIWTLAWSPSSSEIVATGSEDQTVSVWNWKTSECLVTLPKHKRAVTGVRWGVIKETNIKGSVLNEIFITCSDDQSLRVYDPKTWTMLHVFNTSIIKEWHTVTYASIEEGKSRIACVTQNGNLFIMNLSTLDYDFIGRIHNGSIEGLDWKGGYLSTCSAEVLACIIEI